jgi:hypothetical protein
MDNLFIAGADIDGVYFDYIGCYQSFDKAKARCKTDKCFVGEIERNVPQPQTLTGWVVTYPKA